MKRPKNPYLDIHDPEWRAFERGVSETITLNENERKEKKRKGKEEEKMEQ